MMPEDYTLGQFAALDQPPWKPPTTGMAPWPYQEQPAQDEAGLVQQAREAAAYRGRQGYETAATRPQGSNRLNTVAGAVGSIPYAMGSLAAMPGQTMAPNPYPPGSEEAQFYEDQRRSNTYRIAPEAGFDIVTGGMGIAPKGALGMAGGRIKQPTIAPGALAAVDEYRPPFYSAVEQAVQGAKQNAAPGQQWAGFLRNQPGVKPEEVEALKLGKLFEQPGSVPKEAVLGEIAANRVNVGEVMKGERPKAVTDFENFKREIELRHNTHLDSPYDVAKWAGSEAADRYETLLRAAQDAQRQTGPTKFQQYTLPGGENYREMLLTLPGKKVMPSQAEIESIAKTRYEGYHRKENDPPWERIGPDVQRLYREDANAKIIANESPPQYRSSHFDEPNILAHVRYNDRVIDGKKTLFVEEVQSDWHQQGKRKGYQGQEPPQKYTTRQNEDGNWDIVDPQGQVVEIEHTQQRAQDAARQFGEGEHIATAGGGKVPDAPFKTTWPELAMKRIIREAAEKGYDKVAWTPGSVQADRYDLSRHIDHVSFNHNPTNKEPGKIYVAAHPHGGGHPVIQGNFTPKEIEANLGKEIADQIVNGKDTYGAIQKEGLKVGGEGMKGFYDEILPATVNRLVKKHGGRVGQERLSTAHTLEPDQYHDGTWRLFDHKDKSFWQDPQTGKVGVFSSREAAEKVKANAGGAVHTLDITPQLRAQAMKGFPLFTAGGVAATGIMGEMARQDDYRQ